MNKTLTYIDDEIKMLNSYIEECKEMSSIYKKLFEKSGDPIDAHPIEAYKESIEFTERKIARLQECKNEIIDQNKEYTLEECKKMWEELGYEWVENPDASLIILRNKKQDIKIKINTFLKTYYAREYSCFDYQDIEFREHQLLTKTFKALEKEEK